MAFNVGAISYSRTMSAAEAQPTSVDDRTDPAAIDDFICRWEISGGAEIANFQPFAKELCSLLGLPEPDPAQQRVEPNDYVFERRVDYKFDDGTTARRRIDLYKRDCFVMEAKQSAKRVETKKVDPEQPELIPEDATKLKPGTATRGTGRWDKVMRAAKRQAEDYARALPKEHGWPPFILVVDVGHVIEVYADFSGQGKNYAQFPDRDGYSIPLEGLRDQAIRDRLRAIWCAPHSLDPTKRSAEVTRDIAARLARIARSLEGKHDAKEVAEFLMRCLFTMFAEDVGLLPKQGFEKLLGEMVDTSQHFAPALESLWRVMDEGGYGPAPQRDDQAARMRRGCPAMPPQGHASPLLRPAFDRGRSRVRAGPAPVSGSTRPSKCPWAPMRRSTCGCCSACGFDADRHAMLLQSFA